MINGSRVRQARELCGYTQSHLADQLGIHQTTVTYIESGRMQPSGELLTRLALITNFPPAFFEQADPPAFPEGTLLFRARTAMTASVRYQARRYGEIALELVDHMAQRLKVVSPRLPQMTDEVVDISTMAHLTRNVMGLSPNTPIPDLIRVAEKAGIFVLAVPFAHEKLDAFSVWAGTVARRPVVVTFGDVPGDRLRFSVAHELGHLALHYTMQGTWSAFNGEADQFAAELLMPAEAMEEEIETPVTLISLATLKIRWGVSLRALVRRAYETRKIKERQYRYLIQQLNDQHWRQDEPVKIKVEKPRAPRRMAELLYPGPNGGIDYARLADEHRLTISRVKDFMELQAGKPQEPIATDEEQKPIDLREWIRRQS